LMACTIHSGQRTGRRLSLVGLKNNIDQNPSMALILQPDIRSFLTI